MEQESKHYWQEKGDYFDNGYDILQMNSERYLNMLNWFLKEVGSAKKIFEAGAGTGNLTYNLLSEGKKVFAVDVVREALEILKKKCSSLEKNLEVSYGEIGIPDLNIPNNYFDCATSMIVLPFPRDIPAYLGAVYDSLKEGGKFVCASWAYVPDIYWGVISLMEKELREKGVIQEFPEEWKQMKTDGIEFANDILQKKFTLERLLAELKGTGFGNFTIHPSSYNGKYTYQITCYKKN